MKYFSWNHGKNASLVQERGISFEEIVFHIENGDVLDLLEHPNRDRYPNQKVFVVNVEGYAYLVSFVEDEQEVFLKTIIPSRKATRDYLGGSQ
ncbi:MAG: BrnT family toxin [Thermoanaerobaculia bacterium]